MRDMQTKVLKEIDYKDRINYMDGTVKELFGDPFSLFDKDIFKRDSNITDSMFFESYGLRGNVSSEKLNSIKYAKVLWLWLYKYYTYGLK